MTDHSSTAHVSPQPLSVRLRAMLRPGNRWFAPIVFAAALALGLIASAIWLHSRATPSIPAASDTAVAADPTHAPLPTPTVGALSTLPPAAQAAPGAAYIASKPAAVETEATDTNAPDATTTTPETSTAPAEASPTEADSQAQVIERSQPEYPIESLRAHEEGTVRLQVALDALGNVEDVRIASSSGSRDLDRAAIASVRGWHFRPARHAGEAITGMTEVSVDFRMDEQH